MSGRARAGALLVALVVAGCGRATPPAQTTAAEAAPIPPTTTAAVPGPSAALGGVELEVTGFHGLPGRADDPLARSAAQRWDVPISQVVQMHFMLTLRNTGTRGRDVSADALQLGLGAQRVLPVPGEVFPSEPVAPGQQEETAVGFFVAVRPGAGPVTLRWTHGDQTAVLPLGGVRRSA